MIWKKKRLACQTNSYLAYEQALPGHPGVPGWGREEGKESLHSPFFFFSPPERPRELTDFVACKLTGILTMERVLNRISQALPIEYYKSDKLYNIT